MLDGKDVILGRKPSQVALDKAVEIYRLLEGMSLNAATDAVSEVRSALSDQHADCINKASKTATVKPYVPT